jgi:hypothetical protein
MKRLWNICFLSESGSGGSLFERWRTMPTTMYPFDEHRC